MKKRITLFIFLIIATFNIRSQKTTISQQVKDKITQDTIIQKNKQNKTIQLSSNDQIVAKQKVDTLLKIDKSFKPSPKMAVILATAFPGLGQIYNRKYWKLPLLYGGFIGFAYAISWNNKYYEFYFNGYKSLIDGDPNTNDWKKALPYGVDPAKINPKELTNKFKNRKDFYRRFRDLSIIGTVALYGLSIVDAYVDAELFDFDISPDLSMHLEPIFMPGNNFYTENILGIHCSFNF